MVKIRLSRVGKRNDPFYRIVVLDERKKREGKFLDVLGHWHPRENKILIKRKAMEAWINKGAQVSSGVRKLTQ